MPHDRLDARISRSVDEEPVGPPSASHPLLDLQRTAGNAAVQRMLVQREEATAAPGWASQVGDWLFPPTEGEKNDTGASPGAIERWLAWAGVGTADLIAGAVSWLGLEDYDISADLLRHYMSGRGEEYQLDMPQEWAEKIASKYKKVGTWKDVSSYSWGIPDMKNALGHFDLTTKEIAGGGKLYLVTDKYHFPYKPKDKWEQGRHGFEVAFFGMLPKEAQAKINEALAQLGTWQNPGGFTEKFEMKQIGGNWTFMIPQQFLADHGVDYSIKSSFLVLPDGTVLGDEGAWF